MSLPPNPRDFARDDTDDYLKRKHVSLRHPVPSSLIPGSSKIFETAGMEARASGYDIVTPAAGTGNQILECQNPGLLAFRNRSGKVNQQVHSGLYARSQSTLVKKPKLENLSLLNRRPLGKLRDPSDIRALKAVKKTTEQEKASLAFTDDPVAYFSKRKDGRGHRFIYLVHARKPDDPDYSPYELKKVTFAEIEGDYYTMSATGVTFIQTNGSTENMLLDQWARECSVYGSIRKINFFKKYYFWKSFRLWKKFVLNQRYTQLQASVIYHPFFRNKNFFMQSLDLCKMRETSDALLKKYLLAFQVEKCSLEQFQKNSKENTETLKNEFAEFIQTAQTHIIDLYQTVSDPRLVQVRDADFPDIRRRNPNLNQLMVLEKKKAAARAEKTETVNREIISIGSFIRMIDYVLLESLTASCEECWKIADETIAQEGAAVFQVEVEFDEKGAVAFNPVLEELSTVISDALKESIDTLNSLPRLLTSAQIRPHLRDNGLDLRDLFDNGPQLSRMIRASKDLDAIEKHILETVSESYRRAIEHAQQFCEFYPIFLLGEKWDPRDYVRTRSGKPYDGPLSMTARTGNEDMFLLNADEEPVVDFAKVRDDLKTFQVYETKVANLRPGTVRGALYIDSRSLRAKLIPIPTKAITELQELLNGLAKMKTEMIGNALKYYGRQLKQEPKTLEQFVEYCTLCRRTVDVTQRIKDEIDFVDDLYKLLDEFEIAHGSNALNTLFMAFKADQQTAQQVKEGRSENFIKALSNLVRETERKIDHFSEKATNIPLAIKDADVEIRLPAAEKLCQKMRKLEPKIQEIIEYQKIIGIDLNDFAAYEDVIASGDFAVNLYSAVAGWQLINKEICETPFSRISIDVFREDVSDLKDQVAELQKAAKTNYPILNELVTKVNEVYPYIGELERLSKGKMQVRHWNTLFEECNKHTAYHNQITINELLSMKILQMKDRIEKITATSHGESELEGEFQQISNYWNKVQIPLVEQAIKTDENLLLGPTEKLVAEIFDTLATLRRMLSMPFVQGVRDAVTALSSTLENITMILDAWRVFQSNWVVLSALFTQEEARTVLPHQANRFSTIQRKWTSIARHTIKDPRLFSVCAFPSLLDVLHENNESMESILSALGKFLDTKRTAMPRLFFLSNDEVLALCTTNRFSLFSSTLTKLFMHIREIECRESDNPVNLNSDETIQSVQRLKVYGMVGEDGDVLHLSKYVSCNVNVEVWLNQLVENMRNTVRDAIVTAVNNCQGTQFAEWIMGMSTYIASTAMNIVFTREVEDAFGIYENSPKAFHHYDKLLRQRMESLIEVFHSNQMIQEKEVNKIATMMIHLAALRDKIRCIEKKELYHSQQLEWQNTLKFRIQCSANNQIVIDYADGSWEHSFEYWGKVPSLVHTESMSFAKQACMTAFVQQNTGLFTGSSGVGKHSFIRNLACEFGQFLYTARPFPDINELFMSKIIMGAASSGAWTVFTDIDSLSHQCLSYLYDNIRAISVAQLAGSHRIIVSYKPVDLQKGCRILLTMKGSGNSAEFPSQLRAFTRPIALFQPDLAIMVEAKLNSIGFKLASILSRKLVDLVTAVFRVYSDTIYCRERLSALMNICDKTGESKRRLQMTLTEELAVAATAYEYFDCRLKDGQRKSFMSLLYANFKVADSMEHAIERITTACTSKFDELISELAHEEATKIGTEAPADYLAENAVRLYHLLLHNNCVIIAGPPSSGKSTVFSILSAILDKQEIQENRNCGLKPIRRTRIFHGADQESRVYGNIYNDMTLGQTWQYGQINGALHQLLDRNWNNTAVAHFDGPMSPFFVQYLDEFLGMPYENKCSLNSMDSYRFDNFKVVIETDYLCNASPALLGKTAVMTMSNLQESSSVVVRNPTCEIVHPTLPFARAQDLAADIIQQDSIPAIRSVFCDIAPAIVKRVYHTKNNFYYSEADKRAKDGHIIISDVMPMWAAFLTFYIINKENADCTDEKQIRTAMVLAFFRIFSSIMEPKEVTAFDNWLRTNFHVDVPPDWVGYSVPDHFWNVFPRPSLHSMKFFKGKLIPLNFQAVREKPLMLMRGDNQKPIVSDDITVIHAQMLPVLETAQMYLEMSKHFIISGDVGSGKSSFMRALFNGNETITPVYIPASRFQSTENLLPFITSHTNLISKIPIPSAQTKKFAFIFDNINETHTSLIEFIRMLINVKTIPSFSIADQKIYNVHPIDNFVVILTTRRYESLPSRLLGLFAPVRLTTLLPNTGTFIATQILSEYGVTTEDSNIILQNARTILQQYSPDTVAVDQIKLSYIFAHLQEKGSMYDKMKLMLWQLYYLVLHKGDVEEYADKLSFLIKSSTGNENEKNAVDDFLSDKEILYPTFELSKDMKTFKVSAPILAPAKIKEDVTHQFKIFNTNSNEKIVMRFSHHVLKQLALIRTSLSIPGRNLVVVGDEGSGRYTLSRLVANTLECDFVNIAVPSGEETLAPTERMASINTMMRDVVTNASVHHKRTIIFIRYSEKTKTERDMLVNMVSQRDFTSHFSKSALEDLYTRFSGSHQLTYEQRLVIRRQITNIARMNIKIVIACRNTPVELSELVSNNFDRVYLDNYRESVFRSVTVDALEGLATKKVIGTLTTSIVPLFIKLAEIASKRMAYFCPNIYYDFVDCFAHFVAADYQDVLSMNENIQAALEFLGKLENESHQIDKKLDSLAPTLQRLQVDSESLQSSYTTRKEAIESRRAKLDEEHQTKQAEVQQFEEEVKQLSGERDQQAPKIEILQKLVTDLTDNDIETIRITAADPMPSLRILLEIFCMILDRPTSYERGGQKLLMDPHFVQTIVNRVSTTQLTPKLLEAIEPYFEKPELNPDELESIAPSLKILFDWIDCVCKVSILTGKLDTVKKHLEDKQRTLNEYVEEMNLEKASIEQVEASLESEYKALEASKAAREQMEAEYQQVDTRKRSIDSIFKGIDHFTEKWQREAAEFTGKKDKVIGDAIYFSFYLVFCGAMPNDARKQAMALVGQEIKAAGLTTSADDPLPLIVDKFVSAADDVRSDPMFSTLASIDCHHVRATLRTPLLVDPDGHIFNFLTSSMKAKRHIVASQNTSTLDTIITTAMCEGKTLILQDVDYLHPLITPLLQLAMYIPEDNTNREIRVGSKVATWDPRFKLILTSSTVDPNGLPKDLLSRVTVIDVSSSSLETIRSLFENTFLEFFDPGLLPRILDMKTTELSRRAKIQKYERDTLDILADIITTQQSTPDYDYLSDEETLSDLIKAKECYFTALNTSTDFGSLRDEIKLAVQPFRGHVKLCQTFWEVMSRTLLKVTPQARFSFTYYQKLISQVFVNDGLHAGSLTTEQHTTLRGSLITTTFQYVFQSVPLRYGLFFAFVCGYILRQKDATPNMRELEVVIQHMRDEMSSPCDFKATEYVQGDPIDHLKFTNIANIFGYVNEFNIDQFGPEYLNASQPFQVDSIISNSATVPTILITAPEANPTPLIHQFVNLRCRQDNFDTISLSTDLDVIRNTRKVLATALNRGNWTLVHYSKPTAAAGDMLTDIFTQMTSTSVNTNFRLIILTSSLDYLPPSMITRSKRINVESFPSIRHAMVEMFHHHNPSIRSATNPHTMKKYAYAAALLLSIVNYRGFVQPFGMNYPMKPNSMIFRDFLEAIRFIVDAYTTEIPLKNVHKLIQSVMFGHISDAQDRKVIKRYIEKTFIPELVDDGFSMGKVDDEDERWTIPPDAPISNYMQIVQQLPIFSSVVPLSFHAETATAVKNWNLSRWITQAFIDYIPRKENTDIDNALVQIDNIIMLLPERIGTGDDTKFMSPVSQILLNEIERINSAIHFIRRRLTAAGNEVRVNYFAEDTKAIIKNMVPDEWKNLSSYYGSDQIPKFTSHLIQRHSFIVKWLKQGTPKIVDARVMDDLKGFMHSVLAEEAVAQRDTVSDLRYEFAFMEADMEPPEHGFVLTNLSLVSASVIDGKLGFSEEDKSIAVENISLMCKVTKTEPETRVFACPLYKNGFVGENINPNELRQCESESDNFIWECELPVSEAYHDQLRLFGTSIYCRLPDQLTYT